MSTLLDLGSKEALADLETMLKRLEFAGIEEVFLHATDRILAVYGCTLAPAGLLDGSATILVQRAYELAADASLQRVVPLRAVLDRFARLGKTETAFSAPDSSLVVAWAGVLPPRSGWARAGMLDSDSLKKVSQQGSARVAELLPQQAGASIVDQVRRRVWNLEIARGVPAGAAFALDTMGFLQDTATVSLSHAKGWLRLAGAHGNVIVRRPV